MRIRKQAKLAGISISNGISSGDYSLSSIGLFCHFSQSPWDVISFPSDSPSSQIGGYDGFTPNGSSGDSLGAVDSVASMKISEAKGDTNLSDNNGKNAFFRGDERVVSGKTNGKLLKCKNEVAKGCAQATPGAKKTDRSVATTATVVATDRRKKRWVPVSDPEYYYYSGFGPCWGKQRGANEPKDKHYDYIDDYDSDDDDDVNGSGEIGKKRARKPVKARSLKSLM